jgi:carbon-monoxide dehydrogenase medium subunit
MKPLEFTAPTSIDEAVAALADANGEARILAGGTDLLVQLRAGMVKPQKIVDIKHIKELQEIAETGDGIRIGAAVSGAEIGEHAALKAAWPGVVEAMELIGSTQIQGRATAAGNLCNGSPAADCVPALIAANATVSIAGPSGVREAAAESIVTGPGQTSLARGEIVTSINLPKPASGTGDAYLRFIPRTEMDIAVVGAGVCLTLDSSGTCTAARVALGAVAATQLLVGPAADALIGTKIDDQALEKLDAAARAAAKPIDDKRGTVAYRTKVAGVLATRAAKIAAERARS